jgi:hypothetical protein
MRIEQIAEAFSFDNHFAEEGFQTPIPGDGGSVIVDKS